jgi:hypothetical protein
MASSYEIAEQINAQNQWFMQQNALSSQIGVNPMAFGGGMGGYNQGAPFMGNPVMPAAPGGRPMPGAFNYGNNMGVGYGFGNRMGSIAGGALAMAPAIFGTGLSLAAPSSPFINPVAGFGVGRAMGLGITASAGVAGAMMLPAMAAQYAVGATVAGASQQSMIGTAMGGFNFINPASRTGTGFTRNDAMVVGDQIRQLAYIPELMTSVEELTKMIPKLRSSGLMQGVTSAREFASKFKEAIVTVREMSQLLGTTMEQAADFFAHSRSVGMFGKGDTTRNAINAQVAMAATGMNLQQIQALQQSGANLATAAGGSRRAGTTAITNLATQIGYAQQSGNISQEILQDMTGMVGAEAQGAAASRMLNAAVRMSGTPAARLMIAGAMKMDENGTPYIDQNIMKMVTSGTMSFDQLKGLGSNNMQDRKKAIAFTAHQSSLAMGFAAAGGGAAVTGILQAAMGANADPNTTKLLLQQHAGLTEQEAEVQMKLYEQQMNGQGPTQQLLEQIRRAQAGNVASTPGAAFRRISTVLGDKLKKPFLELGAKIQNNVGRWADEFASDLVGSVMLSVAQDTRDRYAREIASGDKEAIRALLSPGTTPVFRAEPSFGAKLNKLFDVQNWGKDVGAVGEWRGKGFTDSNMPTPREAAQYDAMGKVIDKSYLNRDWSGYSREQITAEIAREVYRASKSGKGIGLTEGTLDEKLAAWKNIEEGMADSSSRLGTNDPAKYITDLVERSMSSSRYGGGRSLVGSVEMDNAKAAAAQRKVHDTIREKFSKSGERLIADPESARVVQRIANEGGAVKDSIIAALRQGGNYKEAKRIAKAANLGDLDINPTNFNTILDALAEYKGKDHGDALTGHSNFQDMLLRRAVGTDYRAQSQILNLTAEAAPEQYKALLERGSSMFQGLSDAFLNGGRYDQEAKTKWLEEANTAYKNTKKAEDKANFLSMLPPIVQSYILGKEGATNALRNLSGNQTPEQIATKLGDRGLAGAIRSKFGDSVEMTDLSRKIIADLRGTEAMERGAAARAASNIPDQKDQAVITAMTTIAQAIVNLHTDEKAKALAQATLDRALGPQEFQKTSLGYGGTHGK